MTNRKNNFLRDLQISLGLIVALILITTLADPVSEYTLFTPENDHFRDYSRAEMESYVGEDRALLAHYVCDGQKEFDPFFAGPRLNERRDSLRIQTEEGEYIVYRDGNYFKSDGSPLDKVRGRFPKAAKKAIEEINRYATGMRLLQSLQRSRYPIVITEHSWMMFNPNEGGPVMSGMDMAAAITNFSTGRMSSEGKPGNFHQIGSGGHIRWDPGAEVSRLEKDHRRRSVPSFLTLAHEMYHAFDAGRGLMDRRGVWGDSYEATEVTEYRAMYLENTLRKEAGLQYAEFYGEQGTYAEVSFPNKTLLDSEGRPRLIKAPCL